MTPPRPRLHRLRAVAVATVALVAIGGLAACEPEPPSTGVPDTYVALGDSYMAGPLVLPPDLSQLQCARSLANAPHLAAPRLGTTRLRDVTCSGARTTDFFAPQQFDHGASVPPQLDALDARTKIVSVAVGGNDVEFFGALDDCVGQYLTFSTCQSGFVHDGHDELAARIEDLGPKLDRVYAAIKERAPQAKIFAVGYFPIFDANGTPCLEVPLWPTDAAWVRDLHDQFNALVRERVEAAGGTFVAGIADVYDRGACAPHGTRWVEPLVPTTLAASLHLNGAGQHAVADRLVASVQAAG